MIEPAPARRRGCVTKFRGDSGDSAWMSAPAWSPNGRDIAFIAATDAKLFYLLAHNRRVVPAAGGTARVRE